MIGGLWTGFSGLSTYERALSAESNNSSNTNTVGYKANDVRFEDLMYKNGTGKGSQIEQVFKRFQQGDIKPTGHSLDIGIEGKGYFMVNDPEDNELYYTRAGNFQLGADGLLQTPDGLKVQGLVPQEPQVISTNPNYTQLSKVHSGFVASETIGNENFIQTVNARIGDYSKTAQASGINGEGFKSASSKIVDIEALITDYKDKLDLYRSVSTQEATPSTNQITSLDFTSYLSELKDENDFIKVNINNEEVIQYFDTDVDTTMRLFADKISDIQAMRGVVDTTTGKVTVESMVPAKEIAIYDVAVNNKAASIYQLQNQSLGTGYGIVTSARDALQAAVEAAGSEFIEITSTIDLQNQEALEVSDIQMKLANLNLSEYTFGKISVDEGIVYLADGDNKFVVGKVQTAFFRNDQGLEPQGNNLYKDGLDAGEAQYAGKVNVLHSNSLEVSNTDNADTMTNLLTYQKAFEANSKSITTSDELLKIAINLRK
ncbi:flagellar hook-basal body complex protein [Arcobacter sp. YIC-464]|uniref:flagellar hook-basal body complex protein n=1 Tax=Arcobacter sp. YIC-464 TaxID=3376631 RepID=UPI003C20AEF4